VRRREGTGRSDGRGQQQSVFYDRDLTSIAYREQRGKQGDARAATQSSEAGGRPYTSGRENGSARQRLQPMEADVVEGQEQDVALGSQNTGSDVR
jgi:hypothetical protein